jgi:hypothetical protein
MSIRYQLTNGARGTVIGFSDLESAIEGLLKRYGHRLDVEATRELNKWGK